MHVVGLEFKNFCIFGHLKVALTRGSIGVFGRNGAGKSSFLNGVYALITNDFGRFYGVKEDCVRNTAEPGEDSFISGQVKHGQHTLDIKRKLRAGRSSTEVVIDGGKTITDAKKAQEAIDAVLGIDRRMLDLYVFKTQDRIYDFLTAQPAERAKAYQTLCRTEKCEEIWEFLGTILSKDTEIVQEVVDNSDELEQIISTYKAKIAEFDSAYLAEQELLLNGKSEASAKELIRKHERLEELIPQRDALLERRNRQVEKERAAKEALTTAKSARDAAKECAENLREDAEAAKVALKAFSAYKRYNERVASLEEETAALAAEGKKNKPPRLDAEYAKLSLASLRSDVVTKSNALADAKKIVDAFKKTGVIACPTCGTSVRSLQEHLDEKRELVTKVPGEVARLSAAITILEDFDKAKRAYDNWKAGFDARVAANKKALEELAAVKSPKGDADDLRATVESYEKAVSRVETRQQAFEEAKDAVMRAETQVHSLHDLVATVEEEIAENSCDEATVEKARRRLREHTAAQVNIARLQGERRGTEKQLDDKENELKRLRERLSRSKRVRRLAGVVERAREVLHRDRLPRQVAVENLQRMEGDINDGLESFGSPFWVEGDERLSFIAHKPGEPPQPAERLSTGQRVVLAMAFWPAVASLWRHDLGMLVLDEPTANLDETNRRFLADTLSAMTAKVRGNRQLLLVTHDPNLRTSFDQVIDLGS